MSKYLNGELIRVEPGREGSPVCHVVWDSYAQREVRIYPPAEMQQVGRFVVRGGCLVDLDAHIDDERPDGIHALYAARIYPVDEDAELGDDE